MIPAIFGLSGRVLTEDERRFFSDVQPAGFILFARNVDAPRQVQDLVESLRACVGWRCPVLVDQEGGRVQRLRPPHWRAYPPVGRYAQAAAQGRDNAARAVHLHARLIADDLIRLGVDVNCAPLLDRPVDGADAIIGDRAFGQDIDHIITLARILIDAMAEAGVQAVIKHIPGHGRATVDSHKALPVVDASAETLEAWDLPPFRAFADTAYAMTAHVAYPAWDGDTPATLSRTIVSDIIRSAIGFTGLLMTDDLSMQALGGRMAARSEAALAAGCDLLLHCNGNMAEMQDIAASAGAAPLGMQDRINAASLAPAVLNPGERADLEDEFDALIRDHQEAICG